MGGQDVCQASEVSGVWVPAPEQDRKKTFITRTNVVSNAAAQLRHSQWLHPPRFASMKRGFVRDVVPGDLGTCFFPHHSEGQPLFEGLFQPRQQPQCYLIVREVGIKHASMKWLSRRRMTFLVRCRTAFIINTQLSKLVILISKSTDPLLEFSTSSTPD